jgi:hypothetical protein
MAYFRNCPKCGAQCSHTTKGVRDLSIGLKTLCRSCGRDPYKKTIEQQKEKRLATQKAWKLKNIDKAKEYSLQRYYGLSLAQFNAMSEAQEHKCIICDEIKPLSVDHDHQSGKIRGLLCNPCNRALGWFKDDLECVKRAALYLALDLTNARQLTQEQQERHGR